MITYYCHTLEEALKRAKIAGKRPSCLYCGIVLKNGKRGSAIYMEGIVIEQYSVIGKGEKTVNPFELTVGRRARRHSDAVFLFANIAKKIKAATLSNDCQLPGFTLSGEA